jgi:hypothetical protein
LYFSDIILGVTFYMDGLGWYSATALGLVLISSAIVQIFSARWNKIDEMLTRPAIIFHGLLLGIYHRYL